jgi:hypothetical protein
VSQEPKCSAIKAILQDLSLPKTGFVRNRKPQQLPPPPVTENMKCEELLKGNRRKYKKINRRDPVSVIARSASHMLPKGNYWEAGE